MIARVTKRGVVVPREFFDGVRAVEIRREDNQIVIVPCPAEEDPILGLGTDPVSDSSITDASVNFDKYLY